MAARALALIYSSRGVARMGRAKSLPPTAGLSATAIRIPDAVSARFSHEYAAPSPQLFVHEGARQSLERRLTAASPGTPVSVSVTDNTHAMITHRYEGGVLRVRVHHMFLDAPANVQEALIRYVIRGDREASVLISRYIETNGHRVARRSRHIKLNPRGQHHDLLDIFQQLNDRYFDGAVDACVTWGKRSHSKLTKRKSIKLGSYSAPERLIRVNPALDRSWVPRYFVAYILYHEMLHHMMPSTRSENGRSMLHPPEFLEAERDYRYYERSLAWERGHIGRLLRS